MIAFNIMPLLSGLSAFVEALFYNLARYKDGVSTLESIAKIAALITGAIWAWKGFLRNRLRFPSATLQHVITTWPDEGKTFVRVTVRITNTGNVLIGLASGKTWLEKLTPLPSKIANALHAGKIPIQVGKHEMEWSLIGKHELATDHQIEIEPRETDELHFDFLIDRKISRILVYTYLNNQLKGRKKMGWNLSSIHSIGSGQTMALKDNLQGRGREIALNEQAHERNVPLPEPENPPEPTTVDPIPPGRTQGPEKTSPEPDED